MPLWILHPEIAPCPDRRRGEHARPVRPDARRRPRRAALAGTILDEAYRAAHPIALAEHFYYPHRDDTAPRYRQNIAAAIAGEHKTILRREGVEVYDLARDPDEQAPEAGGLDGLASACRRQGVPNRGVQSALFHLRRWRQSQGHEADSPPRPRTGTIAKQTRGSVEASVPPDLPAARSASDRGVR